MSQDESPQPDRSAGPRFSRDTQILLGALTFLIVAVTLTYIFTPNSGNQTAQVSPTALTGALTPADGAPTGQPTRGAYPEPGATGVGTPTAPVGGVPTGGAYPSPVSGTPALISTGNPSAEAALTQNPAPSTPQNPPLGSPTSEGNPYPEPDGTPPTQPTFNPTVVAATTLAQPSGMPTRPAAGGQQPSTTPATPQAIPTVPVAIIPPPSPSPAQTLLPTSEPDISKEPPLTPTEAPVLPTTPPTDVLRGNVRWSISQSPIMVRRDLQLAPGAELIIEPGVEVRLDPGVSIYVDGARLLALGLPGQHVRFVGSTRARWSGIFGRPNSFMVLENTEVRGSGAGGTVLVVDSSELVVRSSWITDNGGGILAIDTKLELRDTEISGNDVPFGAALDASYARGTTVTIQNNRIGGNRLSDGAPMVRIANQSTFNSLILDIGGNLIRGGTPNLQVITNGPLQGRVACNALVGDGLGFSLRTQTVQVNPNGVSPLSLAFVNNFVDEHIAPVIPAYLKYGLGRGATSEVQIDMRENWWGDGSGPYDPDANPQGRGDSVGGNILFSPWLTQPPACAPSH
ncbi:MAG: hypothetical protein WCJ55_06670 [Chloroflexales bacterium]